MALIDFILNVAGVLLWLNWRSARIDPIAQATPATLVGTLRRAEPRRLKRWYFLAALGALLLVRAFFYGQIGQAANWTPKIDLVAVTLAFPLTLRGHVFLSALLFSLLSFLVTLIVFYLCLLALAVINRRAAEPDPLQKLVLLQLGRIGRWPSPVQAVLPLVTGALLWLAFNPLLVYAGVTNRPHTGLHLAEQGLLVGIGSFYSLRYFLPAILLIHLVASYVYLGSNLFWNFISATARNMLAPLDRLPLRRGKMDFAPLVGIVLILLLFAAPRSAGALLRWLMRTNADWVLWPQ